MRCATVALFIALLSPSYWWALAPSLNPQRRARYGRFVVRPFLCWRARTLPARIVDHLPSDGAAARAPNPVFNNHRGAISDRRQEQNAMNKEWSR